MDKIKVNNQVVSMRKFVKQAKIHAINKCTKQIKFLENRKGNEEQMAKKKRKLQRLLEEVNILKKIKPDSISKLALSKAKDWKSVLAEKNIPLEERCIAILANHRPVQESVEKFHAENSELISKIPELLKEWEEKKSRSSQINKKKQIGKLNSDKDPNKVPIGSKKNAPKSNEARIKHENTESFGNLSVTSDLKSIHNDITHQNFKIRKTAKRKNSSDNISDNFDLSSNLSSPPKKKLLVVEDAKCDVSLSDSSDIANHQDSQNKKLSIKDEVQNGHYDKHNSNDSFSDSSDIANYQDSQNKEKLQIKDEAQSGHSEEHYSGDSLSDSADMVNHMDSQNENEFPVKDKTENDLSFKNDSDDSLSDSSDIADNQSSQAKKKFSNNGKTKSFRSCSNSKQSKAHAVNHKTNLVEKKMLFKNEKLKSCNRKEIKVESNSEENSEKSQDIRSKLLEISKSKSKVQNKLNKKPLPVLHQLNADAESDNDEFSADAYKFNNNASVSSTMTKTVKPEVKNKMKAITMIELDKLQDVDEIPIKKSDSDAEDETDNESGKLMKDPFFLRDGESISESDEDDEKKNAKKRDFSAFKKEPYGNFSKREQRDNSFHKRKFDKHSVNGKNSNFSEKKFLKNKDCPFKDNKRNFKRTFGDNSKFRQNKKNQFASKDNFDNRNGTNNFERNPKVKPFSKIHDRNEKRSSYPPKSNLSNSHSAIKPDDKPLHPSWEARRKLKEAQKVVFQGKRMVF